MKLLKNQSGFTLIELVLIIVVLGILAAVAMVQFGTITDDAKKAGLDGAFAPFNAQLALAVNTLKRLPHDDADATAASFKLEVYDKVTIAGGTAKKKFINAALCANPNCDWRLYVDDDNDNTCEAGEWREDWRYQESTGAITNLAAKSTAGAC
jgi:prepilin-type N-terminal cleavage/methylation domain-containing protein